VFEARGGDKPGLYQQDLRLLYLCSDLRNEIHCIGQLDDAVGNGIDTYSNSIIRIEVTLRVLQNKDNSPKSLYNPLVLTSLGIPTKSFLETYTFLLKT